MRSPNRLYALILGAALVPTAAMAGPLQRYALVIGANSGGGDRPRLKYAVSDAERFARVMQELGGVSPENEIVLHDPKMVQLLAALDAMAAKLEAERRSNASASGRTEFFLYYSGHAD